jgi:hypothetical protein
VLLYGRLPWAAARDGGNLAALVAEIIDDEPLRIPPPRLSFPSGPQVHCEPHTQVTSEDEGSPDVLCRTAVPTSLAPGCEVPSTTSTAAFLLPSGPTELRDDDSAAHSVFGDDPATTTNSSSSTRQRLSSVDDGGALGAGWAALLTSMLRRDASSRATVYEVADALGGLRITADPAALSASPSQQQLI